MNRTFLVILLTVLATGAFSRADEPLVRFPKGNARWTIAFRYPDEKKDEAQLSENLRITKAEVTRKDGVRRDRLWWSNGKTTEVWLIESARIRIFENPENGGVLVVPFNDSTMTSFIPREFDETLFAWIAPQYQKDPEKREGRLCLIFAGNIARVFAVPGLTEKPLSLPPTPHKAWIDAETRLPVALDNSIALHEFTFEAVPSESLILPERYQTELNRFLTDHAPSKRLERLRVRNTQPRS